MDTIDYKILNILAENSRTSASVIGQQVCLSTSAVNERIHKLQNGIIKGYTVQLNPKAIGWNIQMLVGITMEHSRYHKTFIKQVSDLPFVSRCLYLTGEFDFLLEIFASSPEDLQKDHGCLNMMEGVSSIKTFYVLDVYNSKSIPLPLTDRINYIWDEKKDRRPKTKTSDDSK